MVDFSFSISSMAFTSPTSLASLRSDKALVTDDSYLRRALRNTVARFPPREAIENQTSVKCQASGTESAVPGIVDDSKVSERGIDGQMSFGGDGGKELQASFEIQNKPATSGSLDGLKPRTSPKRKIQVLSKHRRGILAISIASTIINGKPAEAFDFGLVAPDQTAEEAESVIREDASTLLQVKAMIDSESWSDARNFARKRASYLKRDIYTIIQAKPRSERPMLRKLYFDLFINVSRLDFAARDEDGSVVLQCYENIVTALTEILSRI